MDHVFDNEFSIAELAARSALILLPLTLGQLSGRFTSLSPSRLLKLSSLCEALLAVRHATEVTVAALEVCCLFPSCIARVAPFRRIVVIL